MSHQRFKRTAVVRAWLAVVVAMTGLFAHGAAAAASSQLLRITVYGGTGRIGSRIVNEALARGAIVTVVTRDPSKISDQRAHLTYVKGDPLDTALVIKQVSGQAVIISALGGGQQEGNDYYTRVAKSYVGALRSLGTKAPRLIHIGGSGSLEVAPGKLMVDTVPNVPAQSDMITHKHALEYYRTAKDVEWTFVSPSMRIEPGTRTGQFRLGTDQLLKDSNGESRISMEDFAVAVIDEAQHPQHIRQRFTVGY